MGNLSFARISILEVHYNVRLYHGFDYITGAYHATFTLKVFLGTLEAHEKQRRVFQSNGKLGARPHI